MTVLSGGLPVAQFDTDGIALRQLPPLRSDGINFTRLLTVEGDVADAAYLATRETELAQAVTDTRPDIVITELFPFGRRVLRGEFMALIGAARAQTPRSVILASVRDILAPPSNPQKAQKTDSIVLEHYDGVLVHSDPTSTPLEQSWPVTPALQEKLLYTGYVAPPPAGAHPDRLGQGEVIVSAGGGSVGRHLFTAAVAAAGLSPALRWRVLVGGGNAQAVIAQLSAKAPSNIILEPARPDFRQMLTHAACSVSMCGYNTALDLLQAGTPSLFIPFDEGGEVEQTLRAESLSHLPIMQMLRAADLTPERLLQEVEALLRLPRGKAPGLRFNGAQESVRIACGMAEGRA
ncbi:glycosyltransferase family protein [Profundibacter sp.]|uniref:glycosyltransferase family protein n=1 Tax=Profundibacter sp. TaxID=3101071 RepID=UPI003D0B79AB